MKLFKDKDGTLIEGRHALAEYIRDTRGRATEHGNGYKTACTTACLSALDIPRDSYRYCQTLGDMKRILSRRGFSHRSVTSYIKQLKVKTVYQLSQAIKKGKLPRPDLTKVYIIAVAGHVMMLNGQGRLWEDTAPDYTKGKQILQVIEVTSKNHRRRYDANM